MNVGQWVALVLAVWLGIDVAIGAWFLTVAHRAQRRRDRQDRGGSC